MKRVKLTVEKRKVLGKKVKKLRKDGILPCNIYGKDIKSIAVQVPYKEFEKIFKEAGETGLVDLDLGDTLRPVLIHNVQYNPLTRTPIHADFYHVNLKEKVKTMAPLIMVGEAKAVADKVGIVLQPLSEVEVEALPEDLPENIEVNIEYLAVIDDQITVADLKLPKGVVILTEPSQVVVKIAELVSKEAQEQAEAEKAAAEAAKAEAAPAEGAAEEAKPETEQAPEAKPASPTGGEEAKSEEKTA